MGTAVLDMVNEVRIQLVATADVQKNLNDKKRHI